MVINILVAHHFPIAIYSRQQAAEKQCCSGKKKADAINALSDEPLAENATANAALSTFEFGG